MHHRTAAVAGALWVTLWAGMYWLAVEMRVPAPPGSFEPRLNRIALPVEYLNDYTHEALVLCPIAAALGLVWLWNRIGRDRGSEGGRAIYWMLMIVLPYSCAVAMIVPADLAVEIVRIPWDRVPDLEYFKNYDQEQEKDLKNERWFSWLSLGLVFVGGIPLYLWLRRKLSLSGPGAGSAKGNADPA